MGAASAWTCWAISSWADLVMERDWRFLRFWLGSAGGGGMALSVLVAGGVGVGDSFCFGGCKIRVE